MKTENTYINEEQLPYFFILLELETFKDETVSDDANENEWSVSWSDLFAAICGACGVVRRMTTIMMMVASTIVQQSCYHFDSHYQLNYVYLYSIYIVKMIYYMFSQKCIHYDDYD